MFRLTLPSIVWEQKQLLPDLHAPCPGHKSPSPISTMQSGRPDLGTLAVMAAWGVRREDTSRLQPWRCVSGLSPSPSAPVWTLGGWNNIKAILVSGSPQDVAVGVAWRLSRRFHFVSWNDPLPWTMGKGSALTHQAEMRLPNPCAHRVRLNSTPRHKQTAAGHSTAVPRPRGVGVLEAHSTFMFKAATLPLPSPGCLSVRLLQPHAGRCLVEPK